MLQNHLIFCFQTTNVLRGNGSSYTDFFNLNYENTDFTFCINIFFLCCLLHDDNKKSVFTEKKKHLNEMYVGFGIVFHLCANSVRLLFPIIKSPNKANRT